MKPRRARVGLGDLAEAIAEISPREDVPSQSLGSAGRSVVAAAARSPGAATHNRQTFEVAQPPQATKDTITTRTGSLPVFGSFEMSSAAPSIAPVPSKASVRSAVDAKPLAARPGQREVDDTSFRVFTPVQPTQASQPAQRGYAQRMPASRTAAEVGTTSHKPPVAPRAAAPPPPRQPAYYDDSDDDDAPPTYQSDEDDGRQDDDLWMQPSVPAKKAQPASVTKTTIVTPAPRVSKSEASAKASPSPAAKAVPMFRDMAYQRVGMDAPNPLVPSTYAKAAPSASADAIDNEARALALRDEEKLYYSKKARPVAFKPKTLSEFKKTEPKEYVELGSLGADLDSDELIAKRANRARIKHFSSALREVNKETCAGPAAPILPKAPPEREKAREQRERALEFAKKVPRPKAQSARAAASESRHDPSGRPQSSEDRRDDPMLYGDGDGAVSGAQLRISAVEELEAKHLHMRAQVDAIRREFGV